METQPPRRSPARFARKYGHKFSALDHLSNASLCSRELGQVQIDCRFRLSQSQWGVLGLDKQPAGILYMDLAFHQSKDCQLTSAVVLITLEEADRDSSGGYRRPRRRSFRRDLEATRAAPNTSPDEMPRKYIDPDISVRAGIDSRDRSVLQVTDHYGPKQLAGEPTTVVTKRAWHFTPEINVLGGSGGGIGYDQEREITQTSRWTFTGQALPSNDHPYSYDGKSSSNLGINRTSQPKRDNPAYRTLKWVLDEDECQRQPVHNNVIRTGFTFEHDMKPFFIRVEIQGKLHRKSDRLMGSMKQLLKFPPEAKKDQGTSLTLVQLDRSVRLNRRLDQIAQGLPLNMERLNLEGVPMQMPSALPAVFQNAQPSPNPSAHGAAENPEGRLSGNQPIQSTLQAYQPQGMIDSRPQERIVSTAPSSSDVPVFSDGHVGQSSATDSRGAVNPSSQHLAPSGDRQRKTERSSTAERVQSHGISPSQSVTISQRIEATEDKDQQKGLEELTIQMAQFPTLLFILQWIFYTLSFLPHKAPRNKAS